MNWPNLFPKNTAIYVSFLTYMAVFFSYAAFLSGNFLDSCRLFGLMQTVHTSAVGCCFHRITCYFLQNCSCNIFLSVAWHIIHLQFHFSVKVYFILQLIPFKCWNSDTACNFFLRKCHTDILSIFYSYMRICPLTHVVGLFLTYM